MAQTAIGRSGMAGMTETLPRRRGGKRLQLAVVALVVLAAVGYLVYSGFRTNVYYQTVSELQAGAGAGGKHVRVAGNVVDGSVVREEGTAVIRFSIADAGGVLPVSYQGAVPDIFGPGIEVVVEGKYTLGAGFAADTMLAKCPSKFDTAQK